MPHVATSPSGASWSRLWRTRDAVSDEALGGRPPRPRTARWRRRLPESILGLVVVAAIAFVVVRVAMPPGREDVAIAAVEPFDRLATTLTVVVDHDSCTSDLEGEVTEYREVVLVRVTGRVDGGGCDDIGLSTPIAVALDLPIGSRLVVDASCEVSLDDRQPCPTPVLATRAG